MKGTVDLTSSGKEKKACEVAKMEVIAGMEISVSVKEKKPSVEAAWRSWEVISGIRELKFCREILGMVRVVYLVGEDIVKADKAGGGIDGLMRLCDSGGIEFQLLATKFVYICLDPRILHIP